MNHTTVFPDLFPQPIPPRTSAERNDCKDEGSANISKRERLVVYLTPRKYLEKEELWKRIEMFKHSRQSPVRLELVHDIGNRFDRWALGVFYEGVRIGYIRKRFYERDDTFRINNFCFVDGVLSEKVEFYCEDQVLTLKNQYVEVKTSTRKNL